MVSFDPHSLRFGDRLILCECGSGPSTIDRAAQAACLADDFDHDVIGNEPSFKSQIE